MTSKKVFLSRDVMDLAKLIANKEDFKAAQDLEIIHSILNDDVNIDNLSSAISSCIGGDWVGNGPLVDFVGLAVYYLCLSLCCEPNQHEGEMLDISRAFANAIV